MSLFLRAFKNSLLDKETGKYKLESFSAGSRAPEVKYYTSEEFDALCDELEKKAAEEKAKCEAESEKKKAEEEEAKKKSLEYVASCAKIHDTLKHEDYTGFFATIFNDKLEVTPIWISNATEQWVNELDGECQPVYKKRLVRCIVAENTYLHHEPTFGGDGVYYNYVIANDTNPHLNAFAPSGNGLVGYFSTRDGLQKAIEALKKQKISELEAKIAEAKKIFSTWSF